MPTMHPDDIARRHVSTGRLPPAAEIEAHLGEIHARYRDQAEGRVSDVYPALARVAPALFGIALAGTDGSVHAVGEADHPFAIMSVSKPFVLALVCEALGWQAVRDRIGANATGKAFNSVAAIEASPDGRTNPMVNAGAIATTSLVPGEDAAARWRFIHQGLSRFAGRDLRVDEEVYESASATNVRNRSIAQFLRSRGRIFADPDEAVDLYTRQCALGVTARDLAVMGATLADGGVNPLTGARVVDPMTCHYALAVMATAGMYENSGEWLCDIGLPGKSGIGGGIVTVAPGKGGLGTFSPLLDAAGNSVRGIFAAQALSQLLGMDLLLSAPAG